MQTLRTPDDRFAELPADPSAPDPVDAPFPDDPFRAEARIFPSLVPASPDDPAVDADRAARQVVGRRDASPVCCFRDGDGDRDRDRDRGSVTTGGDQLLHFFREDDAPQLVGSILDGTER